MKKILSVLLLLIGCSNPPKTKFYNYKDLNGEQHIFTTDIYKLKETDYHYCYEHETLHKLEVKGYAQTTMMVDSTGSKHFYEHMLDNSNNWCYVHNRYEYVEALKTLQE
jgi:hypothetical protein|tara:strand:+ start:307 stop:633 length:327 start_codon:yes stop_codon:yes gene_type:complete